MLKKQALLIISAHVYVIYDVLIRVILEMSLNSYFFSFKLILIIFCSMPLSMYIQISHKMKIHFHIVVKCYHMVCFILHEQ